MSNTTPEQLCKQPYEKRKYGMDFYKLLSSGETISSITSITSEKLDESTSDLIITSSGIETGAATNSKVTFWIESGVSVNYYRVEVRVETDDGQKLEGDGILKVSDR